MIPIYRNYHHHEMTFSMLYAFSENYVLPISHDEVVHGKGTLWGRMPGNDHVKAAGLRSLLAYQWAHPGKQLLFMGQEFGQRAEWSEERGVDWYQLDEHSFSTGIQTMVRDINAIYRDHPALWSQDTKPEGYSWIDANDSANNVLSFLRFGSDGSVMACVFNFSGAEHSRYRLGPAARRPVARDPEHRRHHLQRRRASAIWAGWTPPTNRGTAGPRRRCWRCRRRRRCGWCRSNGCTRRDVRVGGKALGARRSAQYSALARLRRPAMTSGSAGSNSSNSSISRVRTVVRSSSAVRLHQCDQAIERVRDVLVE